MFADVRKVFVIQEKSSGLFLTEELYFSRSLRNAGRCHDEESAHETAVINLGQDFEISSFYELAD